MKRILALLISLHTVTVAQSPFGASAADILHQLQKLEVAGSVLYVAAHPDDENTRLLSYLSKERKVEAAYLSLTRGEGGQNLIGSEHSEALGLLRAQELLAARRIDGAAQYFTRAADFGYSKTPEETFSKWNRDSVLADMVLVIRRLRPDLIICRFPTTGEGGHGHHTASAILASEAFEAAADPEKFPAQLKHYGTWRVKRIFWNTFNFGGNNTTGPGQFTLEVGGYNPLLGRSYGEIAAQSRSMHKSQGFGSVPQRGGATEYFRLIKGDSAGPDLFSGIDLRLASHKPFREAASQISKCIRTFDPVRPSAILPVLSKAYTALEAIRSDDPGTLHWKQRKLAAVSELMLACSGLWLDASSAMPGIFPGQDAQIELQAINRGQEQITIESVRSGTVHLSPRKALLPREHHSESLSVPITGEEVEAQFAAHNGIYNPGANLQPYAGQRTSAPLLNVAVTLKLAGVTLSCSLVPHYRKGDPVKGEVTEPLYLLPPAEASFSEKVYVFAKGEKKTLRVVVTALADSARGTLVLRGLEQWKVKPFESRFVLHHKGAQHFIDLEVEPSGVAQSTISVALEVNGRRYPYKTRWISYDHIPKQLLLEESRAVLLSPGISRGLQRVAYVAGAGDEVPECLRELGYTVTMLTPGQLNKTSLREYDAVVTGVRAFNVHESLHEKMPVLLDFVKDGGNLLVQYNTNSRVGPLRFTPGPYPFTISRQRVTDENSPLSFADSLHPAFNSPNKISAADFQGWVQERGIYFASDVDARYLKPLKLKDPGEDWLDGSIITAKYGKGRYVYTGLAFFRQLPAGVPGAYRLFANLLGGKND